MNPTLWDLASNNSNRRKHSWTTSLMRTEFKKYGIESALVNDESGSVIMNYNFYIKRSYLGALDLYYKKVGSSSVQDRLRSIPVRISPAKVHLDIDTSVIWSGFHKENKVKRDLTESDIKSGYYYIITDKEKSSCRVHHLRYHRSYLQVNLQVPILPKTDILTTHATASVYRDLLEKKLSAIHRDLKLELTLDEEKSKIYSDIEKELFRTFRARYVSSKYPSPSVPASDSSTFDDVLI